MNLFYKEFRSKKNIFLGGRGVEKWGGGVGGSGAE